MLFDEWLEPGNYSIETGSEFVCYENTWGTLRNSNWTRARVVPTTDGRRLPRRPRQIVVATD